jgi:hypothetical protein
VNQIHVLAPRRSACSSHTFATWPRLSGSGYGGGRPEGGVAVIHRQAEILPADHWQLRICTRTQGWPTPSQLSRGFRRLPLIARIVARCVLRATTVNKSSIFDPASNGMSSSKFNRLQPGVSVVNVAGGWPGASNNACTGVGGASTSVRPDLQIHEPYSTYRGQCAGCQHPRTPHWVTWHSCLPWHAATPLP